MPGVMRHNIWGLGCNHIYNYQSHSMSLLPWHGGIAAISAISVAMGAKARFKAFATIIERFEFRQIIGRGLRCSK